MPEDKPNTITVQQLKTYLYSLEKKHEAEKTKRIQEYLKDNEDEKEQKQNKAISKIEKAIDKEYGNMLDSKDNIMNTLEEMQDIPMQIEKLQIAEYMIYRVDLMKAEKYVNKITSKLDKQYNAMKDEIDDELENFPELEELDGVDFSEFDVKGNKLAKTKEQYKLQLTEEQRDKLIEKDLEIVSKLIQFNQIPMPHEVLKTSDKDIQSKMQKFNNMRQKRIRILGSMANDYKKTVDSKEVNLMIDDAIEYLSSIQEIFTDAEYNAVKKMLIKRRKRIFRGTKDLRNTIAEKEKKTGVLSFNIQEARYQRMEDLRQQIVAATGLIKQYPIEETQEQLKKLKASYAKEKQFAAVIEKLNNERDENSALELKTFETRIAELERRITSSKQIIDDQENRIAIATKELVVLWKIEINEVISRRHNSLEIAAPAKEENVVQNTEEQENTKENVAKNLFSKLRKTSGGKHACT